MISSPTQSGFQPAKGDIATAQADELTDVPFLQKGELDITPVWTKDGSSSSEHHKFKNEEQGGASGIQPQWTKLAELVDALAQVEGTLAMGSSVLTNDGHIIVGDSFPSRHGGDSPNQGIAAGVARGGQPACMDYPAAVGARPVVQSSTTNGEGATFQPLRSELPGEGGGGGPSVISNVCWVFEVDGVLRRAVAFSELPGGGGSREPSATSFNNSGIQVMTNELPGGSGSGDPLAISKLCSGFEVDGVPHRTVASESAGGSRIITTTALYATGASSHLNEGAAAVPIVYWWSTYEWWYPVRDAQRLLVCCGNESDR